jgi:chloramphenicol O-acetyltransferase type A
LKYIDIENWKRRKHFEFFKKFEYPHFTICANVDITNTYRYSQKNKHSLFQTVLFALMKCCNEMEEFRYRIIGDKIAIYDEVHPGITYIAHEDIYSNVVIPYKAKLADFLKEFEIRIEDSKDKIVIGSEDEYKLDLIYISSLPWISFTAATNPVRLGYEDSVPRIIFGKHFKQEKKIMMPFSVQVNHCLMDGIHASKYFYKITEVLSDPEKYFN